MNKLYIPTILLICILIGGWFYWFQYRPSEIRAECNKRRQDFYNKIDYIVNPTSQRNADARYTNCLNEHGLSN